MVKLGKAFSILVVLTLLILLAPVAILAPPQNVAALGEAVTEEIEAGFSFSETSDGDWYTFQAGSGSIQAGSSGDPRLALVQYTRQNVVIPGVDARVPGCGFRNYTTGSGTVASTVGNLTGTMTLEWITFRFNQAYSHTPIYMTATDFGWISGRGHIDEGGGDEFAFVFIADLDCNDDMTVAAGKGVMQSVEENGRFGDMANGPELRHKIIGDFDIALSGGTYTGNFTLRNYPPNEVYNEGCLNVTGGVMQEFTDDINPGGGLEILNVTSDGPMSTPADVEYSTGFEEIDWGKDPIKIIAASDRLGANATMDLTRNSVLYLNMSVEGGTTYITIQCNPICMLHINDTYGVTTDDGSPYGELWEYLVLSLPRQTLPLGGYFNQTGYTWAPFGTVNGQPTSTTECYAGAESFADAVIYIESSTGSSLQYSHDITYGLFPHPKVSSNSVVPNTGSPGATIPAVTITGKYFLRAAGEKSGWHPNSGSVDFGDGITVNSYTVDSPKQITANITIGGGASIGKRDVTVTSCFGYSNGNGTAPYKTGTLVDGFEVVGADATLEGQVSFKSRGTAPDARWIEPFLVRCFQEGNLNNEIWSQTATTDNNGVFTITGLTPGTYDIGIKNCTGLSELSTSVTLSAGNTTVVDFGEIREGDSDGNDAITILDFSKLAACFGTSPPGNPNCDFDRNNAITILDFSLLAGNFGQAGPLQGY